ncbi:hypothetical protein PF005_g19266 [Phytophthora fragariae]|uniref:Uncharacterized protein n=1 Tax=Phytophthora fragariae TaxID=53985 RepID=A0A6A3X014_9STRA|nr:hypothetical protein PF003_g20372 [Phytophthora fragariae]KAE8929495.1 hypothetical protein PF009_g20387 [Phytophthora fragariae]KAE8990738.1 hypothetical protein PF011_g18225 [Phytophthora fragariae]KAE9089648.1 hypothetical protein PF010_g18904 [Phytophthora fragariae]KAE9090129.1 hypothetical protein PF007_g19350 [Phytophthora fragariae]
MAAIAAARASTNSPPASVMMMPTSPTATSTTTSPTISTKLNTGKTAHPNRAVGVWSSDEHDRFLEALKKYPQGPWKAITEYVGTRSVRQVQTHAQKYQEKVTRRLHGMQTGKAVRLRREHRIDHDVLALHTLISSPPELRNKHARRSHLNEAKQVSVVTPPMVKVEPPAPVKTPEFQRPTIELSDKDFCPITDTDGASPSSVSSSFLFDDSVFALVDADDLPTLSESLDFFIENFC